MSDTMDIAQIRKPGTAIEKQLTPVSLRTVAMPADTNPNGDIFGGWILSQMDMAGGTHAFYEAQGRVATVAVTAMKFHKPVNVGDEISCYCATERVGRTSIAVRVETWVRRRRLALEEQVTEGLFTFVAIDTEGLPRPVERAGLKALERVSGRTTEPSVAESHE